MQGYALDHVAPSWQLDRSNGEVFGEAEGETELLFEALDGGRVAVCLEVNFPARHQL